MSSNAAARKAPKKKSAASAGSSDPNSVIPIESLYPDQEVKTEASPLNVNWFDMVNQDEEPPQPSSPLDPEDIMKIWNQESSPFMLDNVLSDLINQHPMFPYGTPTQPLTEYNLMIR